jgi:hypothetical protein
MGMEKKDTEKTLKKVSFILESPKNSERIGSWIFRKKDRMIIPVRINAYIKLSILMRFYVLQK